MRFFWSYAPDYWEGLRRRGLLRGEIGVRFVQSPWAEPASLFNRAAAPGTPLHRLLHEGGYGLLVDRCGGGCPYRFYEFDRALLNAYAARLGDAFLGVQLHEWMGWAAHLFAQSRRPPRQAGVSSGESIRDVDLLGDVEGDALPDAGPPEYPEEMADFIGKAANLYRRLSRRCGGCVNLVDSGVQSYLQGLRLGARHVMPELGNQTPLSRLQVAYARGMARAAGRSWGVYYECWGGSPFSVTCHTGTSLWRMPAGATGSGEGIRHGGAGGSSRSLQGRLLLFSWLAGAGSFAEEWGDSNTFFDWTRCELTPYGQIIQDYLDLADAVAIGDPVTPVGLVLDPSLTPLEVALLAGWIDKRLRLFPIRERDLAVRPLLTSLFWPSDPPTVGHHPTRGNDWYNLTNTPWPDVFDIIPADAEPAVFDEGEAALRGRLNAYRGEWLSCAGGVEAALARLRDWLRARLPVWVDGPCAWMLNRRGEQWLLAVFNNEGVHRTADRGEWVCDALTSEVRIAFPPGVRDLTEVGVAAGAVGRRVSCRMDPGYALTAAVPPGHVRLWNFRLIT
jgi:hypothetical protein